MRRKFYYTLLALLWITIPLVAQDATVSGTVKDDSGAALPGVNILIKGTTTGTTSDINGKYSISTPPASTLVFSFIGFLTEEVSVDSQTKIDVMLITDITTLSELVVVGYGVQEKKDITGSVAVVNSEVFESRPNGQFGNLISGKTAGVQVISPSGKPSAGFSIRVRGTNSIDGSSEPLYVVDGVPSSDTRTINPADIESISVLKDASSAAIYGAQGSNGVVLITTKRAKSDTPKFEFGSYVGYATAWKTLDVLNSEQYRDLMTELGQNTDWTRYTSNTDWQNEIFQKGTSQNYQLSVSGRNDKTNYYVSGGWMQQKGSVRSSEMDRYNLKVSLEQKVSKWLTFGTNINYMRYHDVDVSDNQAINQGGVILGMLSTPPNIGIYNTNGTFTSNPFQDWENPVSSTDGNDRGFNQQRVLGNVYAEIQILKDLKFRTNVGIDANHDVYDYFLDPFRTSYGRAKKGIARNSTNNNNMAIFDNTLTYARTFGLHNFSAMAGTVLQSWKYESNYIETNGFANAGIPTTGAGSTIISANNSKSETANNSLIGRITYDYNDKYLLTVNMRRDGSANFGPNKRFGYFPSFSVGWRLSEETFMAGLKDNIEDLKIRFGYGLSGNDKVGSYAYFGRVGYGANYPIGGVILPGSSQNSIENRDLKWESTEQSNLGLDLTILDGRLTFTADAYIKNTSDLLLNVPLPRSTGFDTGLKNVGKIQNKGLEFQVDSKNLTGDLKWETNVNLTLNRNKVIDIVGQTIIGGGIPGRDDVSYTTEGKPLGMFYGYIYAGVDPETGDAYYLDKNGESTFTPAADDRTYIGNPNPDFFFGLTNSLSYKNFELSLFLQGQYGNDIFNATRIETEGMTDAKSQTSAVLERWRQPGDVTDIPRAVWGNTNNSRTSTRFVEDGSFMRVKALTLSYFLPQDIISKVKLTNAKLYFTGENLLTFTKYKGYDPEVNAYGGNNTILGVDFGTYPQTRNLIVGVNLTF
jgi:TonB-dependent starch-binding outer membrane protein SusC